MPTVQSSDIIDAQENYAKIATKGQIYFNETYDIVKNLPLIVVPGSSGGINLPSMPTGKMRIRNLSGNQAMYFGGIGDDAPYILDNGVFHGFELLGDQIHEFPINNGSILSVVAAHSGQRINAIAFLNGNDVQITGADPDPADFTPPLLLSTSPSSGFSGVELDLRSPDLLYSGLITLTFNESLSLESGNFTSGNFSLRVSGDVNGVSGVLGVLDGVPGTLGFSTMSGIQGNKLYQMVVGAGIMDENGNQLGIDYTIPFTSYTTPSNPVLLRTWPSSGASGLALDLLNSSGYASGGSGGKIWATFDRDLLVGPTNANSGNISLHIAGGNSGWSGDQFIDPDNPRTIIFGPTNYLSGSASYEMILGSGIMEARYGFNQTTQTRIPFTTTTNPPGPTLVSSWPSSGASGIPLDLNGSGGSGGVLWARFDRDLVSGSSNANSGNISLRLFGGGGWSGTQWIASGDPRTLVLDVGRLSGGSTYEIVLGSGIREASRNIIMGTQVVIPFISDANPTPPSFVSSWPASGASGIALDMNSSGGSGYASVTFNKNLLSGSSNINSGNISLRISGSSGWSGAQFLQPGDPRTIVFDPASSLSGSKVYQVVLGSGLREEINGIPLGQTITIPWITDANPPPPDTTPPFISSFSPAFNALGVANTVQPQFVYNEKIQSGSINTNGVGLWQSGVKVSGALTIDADQKTITFVPAQNLSGSTVYNIRASGANDTIGNTQTAASGFSGAFTTAFVDSTPPFVNSANPDRGGTSVARNIAPQVVYNEYLTAASVSTSTVQLYQGSSPVVGTVTLGADNATVTFTPSSLLSGLTQYNLRASGVRDLTGNVQSAASGYSGAFTTIEVDVTPPFVSSVNPARGATSVAVNTAPQVVYSESLLSASVSTSTVQLYQGSTAVSGSVSLAGDNVTVTFTPSSNLSGVTVYNLRASGVKDLALNIQTAGSGYSGAFTTIALDTTPPFVSSGTPSRGLSGVSVSTAPNVVYNESLSAASVSTSTIQLYQAGSPVAGSVALGADLKTCTFTPAANMTASAIYNLRASGVKDAAGNTQTAASGYSGAFTTDVAPINSTPFYNASDNNSSRFISSTNSSNVGWRFTASSSYLGKIIARAQVTLQRATGGGSPPTGDVVLHLLNSNTGAEKMRLFLNGDGSPTFQSFSTSKTNYVWNASGTPTVTIASTDVFVVDASGAGGTGDNDKLEVFRNSSDVQDSTRTHYCSTDWNDTLVTTDTSGFDMAGILYEPA